MSVEEGRVGDAGPPMDVAPCLDEEGGAVRVGMHVRTAQADGKGAVSELSQLR